MEIFTAEGFWALLKIIGIDLVLAGDNAIVIGLAVAGLPAEQRRKAIVLGIAGATVLRIIFALMTTWLLGIKGVLLIGGVLLLYVCWKMFSELRDGHANEVVAEEALTGTDVNRDGAVASGKQKTLKQAAIQILIADVSMSLDNVLAVAGAAKGHPTILVIGLAIAILMMAFAATLIANLLARHRWIAWVGLVIILYVAADMIWSGYKDLTGKGEPAIEAATGAVPPADPAGTTTAPAPATPAPATPAPTTP